MGTFDTNEPAKVYELCPDGFFPARLYSIVDLGTHDNSFKDILTLKREVRFTFELSGAPMEDGRPFVISKNFTLSRSKKGGTYISSQSNTFKTLKKWLGHTEEAQTMFLSLPSLIGKECELEIEHKKSKTDSNKTYANVVGISKLRRGQTCDQMVNCPVVYATASGKDDIYESMPQWLKNQIDTSYEFLGGLEERIAQMNQERGPKPDAPSQGFDDDAPF